MIWCFIWMELSMKILLEETYWSMFLYSFTLSPLEIELLVLFDKMVWRYGMHSNPFKLYLDVWQSSEYTSDVLVLNNLYSKFIYYFVRHSNNEVRNSWVTKSSYETELRKMNSHFELITRKFSDKFFCRVTNSTL